MSKQTITMPDYLGNLAAIPTPPINLMHAAADALAKSTKGMVKGSVFTLNPGGSKIFRYTFYLRAPALNDYTYPIFHVAHDENLYPVSVLRAGDNEKTDTKICADEEALRQEFETIFQEHSTRQLVRALIVQIGSEKAGGVAS